MGSDVRICAWGHGERFQNYRKAVSACGGRLYSAEEAGVCDGLLLQGGGDLEPWRYGQANHACRNLEPERDRAEWMLLDKFIGIEKPILGICRGMQVLNVYFGGDLIQDLPGHTGENGQDGRHRVVTASGLLQALYGTEMEVNSAHHQAVGTLGDGLRALQWAPDGTVEAIGHCGLPILGVQWHPERLRAPRDGWALMAAFLDLCRERRLPENKSGKMIRRA